MNCSECAGKLNEFCDGELAVEEARAVVEHAASCPQCAAELDSLRRLRVATGALPRTIAPGRDLWPAIMAQIEQAGAAKKSASSAGSDAVTTRKPRGRVIAWAIPLAVAASLVLIANVANRHAAARLHPTGWQVVSLAGVPRVNALPLKSSGELRRGQWLVTDSVSRAKVTIGSIGEVSVEPNSRMRLVESAPTDHRIELARGTMNALIWAPPRLFFVDTPSGTAVDLGCAYTLSVDDRGGGELRVTAGYVALEYGGRESIVPAGLMCLTRPGVGPGVPFRIDAPPELRSALEQLDFGRADAAAAVRRLVDGAGADDAVMLWHLLGRSPVAERGAVYDALARHHPPPAGTTRPGILTLDAGMLRAWGEELGLNSFATR
ncbi:MAG: anti-sigma factor [Opitutaceae bacterium]|nr:anti-sigma factor [Opitutaceae bacterium]